MCFKFFFIFIKIVGFPLSLIFYSAQFFLQLNREKSKNTGVLTYNRISSIMPTYYPKKDVKQPLRIAEAYNNDGYKVAHFYTENQVRKFEDKYSKRYKIIPYS